MPCCRWLGYWATARTRTNCLAVFADGCGVANCDLLKYNVTNLHPNLCILLYSRLYSDLRSLISTGTSSLHFSCRFVFNFMLDCSILRGILLGGPILRIYQWQRQKVTAVEIAACYSSLSCTSTPRNDVLVVHPDHECLVIWTF